MDRVRRLLLQTHQNDIIRDLDMKYIIDGLFSHDALSREEFDYILNEQERKEQVRIFLEILQGKGADVFQVFVDSLIKDYHWIWEKLQLPNEDQMDNSVLDDSFDDSLLRGSVPRLPYYYVDREQLRNSTWNAMLTLRRHKCIVLHGMPGSGKSTLATGLLRRGDKKKLKNFTKGNIFWINVGDCQSDESILDFQIRLHRKAMSQRSRQDSSNFIVGSVSLTSLGSSTIDSSDLSWKHFVDNLSQIFEDENLRESLIVLDDVVSQNVVEAFDIGCKLIITIRDLELVKTISPDEIISVPNSLSEEESLSLISTHLNMPISELPKQASSLHRICKGAPLIMALLGSLLRDNRERLIHDKSHWNFYTKKLTNKEYTIFWRNSTNGHFEPFKAIEMCINNLNPKLQNLMTMLLVLPDDTKIGASALSTIWRLPLPEVENVMRLLKNKSLVIEYFDVEQKSYLYEIHDLVLSYLRSAHPDHEQQALHRSVIDRYKEGSNGSLVNLPNDGYISYYIGYHLTQTGDVNYWRLFSQLYLDLEFVGRKIRLAGPTSLLRDLELYENRIVQNEKQLQFLSDLRVLVNARGVDLRRFPLTTLTQTVLQYCGPKRLPSLYSAAQNAAVRNPSQLLFSVQRLNAINSSMEEGEGDEEQFKSLEVVRRVTALSFSCNHFLIGDHLGYITVYDILSCEKLMERTMQNIQSPGGTITDVRCILSMATCPSDTTQVAVLAQDGHLSIFEVEDSEDNVCCTLIYGEILPWWHTGNESNNGHVSWSSDGSAVLVYNGHTVSLIVPRGDTLLTHSVSADGSITAAAANIYLSKDTLKVNRKGEVVVAQSVSSTVHIVQVLDVSSGDCLYVFTIAQPALQMQFWPDSPSTILCLTNNKLSKLTWANSFTEEAILLDMAENNLTQRSKRNEMVICENKDLVFISVGSLVLLCHLSTGKILRRLHDGRGVIIGMDTRSYWSEEHNNFGEVLLLVSEDDIPIQKNVGPTGCTHSTVRLWYISPISAHNALIAPRNSKLTSLFDCSFSWHWGSESPNGAIGAGDKRINASSSPRRGLSTASLRLHERPDHDLHSGQLVAHAGLRKTSSLERRGLRPLTLKHASYPLTAVIDEDEHIQIFRGRKLYTAITSKVSPKRVLRICVSGKTGRVYTGHVGGTILEHCFLGLSPVNGQLNSPFSSKKLMDLGADVHYLALVGGIVLCAGAQDGRLMAYRLPGANREGRALMLISGATELGSSELLDRMAGRTRYQPTPSHSSSSDIEFSDMDDGNNALSKISPVVECLWLRERSIAGEGALVSVHTSGAIKLWSISGGGSLMSVLEAGRVNASVRCCTHLPDHLLLIAENDGYFHIYEWQTDGEMSDTSLSLIQRHQVSGESVTCCDLTADGALAALGLASGNIILWHVNSGRVIQTLLLHRSAVQSVRFSPLPLVAPPASPSLPLSPRGFTPVSPAAAISPSYTGASQLLLSLAGQLICWDVSMIRANNARIILQKRRDSGVLNGNVISKRQSAFNLETILWEAPWSDKKSFNDNRSEVLSCIKLSGDGSGPLLIDANFSCVAVGDRAGDLLLLAPLASPAATPPPEPALA